ncbi:hypothetical protein RJ639_008587 [Escallonia herrerae]|uniref:DNA-directed RNA polymerase subunit n=1 Tax=Escallonia herrerae TaxID=1293975 RepID=A0AA89AUZ5_9ASTE|nr:hypothetical protein RJ639_008587 [Escallonia herrerae]
MYIQLLSVVGKVSKLLPFVFQGPASKNGFCATCHGSFQDCPGHYGYLALALPVYNVGYLSTIVDILKCICKSCSRILLVEKERVDALRKMRNSKLEPLKKSELYKKTVKRCTSMASTKKAVKCSRCGYINGMVKKATGMLGVIHDRGRVTDNSFEECNSALSHTKDSKASITLPILMNPDRVLSLFKKMLDEDCELLYLSDRPEKLVVTNIAVPPIAIRPSVFVDGGNQSNENDITERLRRIIEANASLHKELSETSSAAKNLAGWAVLQMEVAQYINSDVRGVPLQMQADKPLSGFVQRLKGKQGRFRGNLSGKRVEYTGRTVISPDPNLKITEVAIPILMASILTYPERVSNHNIEKLRQCVRNGMNKYPGAKFIRQIDGTLMSLKFSARKRLADELKFGDIVHRHLEDGDIVLFNRQPSLHRMSIMCHRARIMPWRTLRFNESVCNPYNADFDGDEMNMHVPQTEEARTEAVMLMGVHNNLCTPKNGEILVASTQDFLTSSFLITRKDTFYDRASFSLICSYLGDGMDPIDLPTPAFIKPVELWTGKQLFSVLLRPHADMRVYLNLTVTEKNYSKKGETMCLDDGFVYFRNSELVSGQLGKATLGMSPFLILLHDYGFESHKILRLFVGSDSGCLSLTLSVFLVRFSDFDLAFYTRISRNLLDGVPVCESFGPLFFADLVQISSLLASEMSVISGSSMLLNSALPTLTLLIVAGVYRCSPDLLEYLEEYSGFNCNGDQHVVVEELDSFGKRMRMKAVEVVSGATKWKSLVICLLATTMEVVSGRVMEDIIRGCLFLSFQFRSVESGFAFYKALEGSIKRELQMCLACADRVWYVPWCTETTTGNGNKDGLYSVLLRDYSAHAAAACMNRLAKFSARWIGTHGFSIGIDDVQPGDRLNKIRKAKIDEGRDQCDELLRKYHDGKLDLQPGCDADQTLEASITQKLSNIRDEIGTACMRALHWKNSPLIMSQCGSKGSPINICQMIACVGQQAVGGLRAPDGFIDRSLPHFPRKSKTPAVIVAIAVEDEKCATGCADRGFSDGINLVQIKFEPGLHLGGGHVEIVVVLGGCGDGDLGGGGCVDVNSDWTVMVEGLWLLVEDKGFVANSFYSGLTATEFFFHTMGGREGLVDTAVKTAETGYMSRRLIKALEDLSINYDNTVRNSSACIVQFIYGDDGMDSSQMEGQSGFPLNFGRLLSKVKATCPAGEDAGMSVSEFLEVVDRRLSRHNTTSEGALSEAFRNSLLNFVESCAKKSQETRNSLKLDEGKLAGEDLKHLENIALNVSGVTSRQLEVFLKTCISRYQLKKIESGTAIGAIGAHSIGEPGTQMTLKTFHFAGVGSMNVTLGVPRIKEIIDAAKKISTPLIKAKLICFDNLNVARIVKGRIEKTILSQVAKSVKIVMTSRSASIVITLDMEVIQASQLGIDAHTVKTSILQTPKIKLKDQHIKILDARKLEVCLQAEKSKLNFQLHILKNKLPTVIVKGEVLGITRYGIQKMKDSVLMLASFEKTADHLFNASVNGRDDKIEGVSECIIMGIPMQIGTGMLGVRQRVQKVELSPESDPILSEADHDKSPSSSTCDLEEFSTALGAAPAMVPGAGQALLGIIKMYASQL